MRSDLIDWTIQQSPDGGWVASAPGLGVSLEGAGGLIEAMVASGVMAADGAPAGRQEAFSLAMDRAIHQIRSPGPEAVKAALHDAIETCAELKVIINTPGADLGKVRATIGRTVKAARELDGAVAAAVGAIPLSAMPEFRAALSAALVKAAATAREMLAYCGDVAVPANAGEPAGTIVEPWREIAAVGDQVVLRAMAVAKAIDSIGYQYEERWLVAQLDGVYVYVVGRAGRLHVFVSKQRLRQQAEQPPKVA